MRASEARQISTAVVLLLRIASRISRAVAQLDHPRPVARETVRLRASIGRVGHRVGNVEARVPVDPAARRRGGDVRSGFDTGVSTACTCSA